MKKILQNRIFQFIGLFLIAVFVFSVVFPKTRTARFFRNGFLYLTAGAQNFLNKQGLKIQTGVWNIEEISRLKEENNKLKAEKRKLIEKNSQLNELKYENQVLREQLGLKEKKPKLNLLAAEIIAHNIGGFSDVVLINKGRKDGVEQGASVVSGDFLIGRVKKAYAHTAHLQFITSTDSIVNGMLQKSRALGLVKGGLGYELKMESIPKDTKIEESENVITSGLGGNFPKGLIIGRVEEVVSGQGDIFKKANLITPINFSRLEIVFVVK